MHKFVGFLTGAAAGVLMLATAAHADPLTREQAKQACSSNPPAAANLLTPYGETAAEKEAKAITFKWNCTAFVTGSAKEAFEKYVSKDFCDHSHLVTSGRKACGNYEETLSNFERMAKQFGGGPTIELPTMATVNGEMVTMYGEGVDVFRVKNGKLTDHWDASPPAEITLHEHAPGFTEWVLGDRKGAPPMNKNVAPTSVLVDQTVLTAVNVGPLTPYAEIPQEMANKRVLFVKNYLSMILGQSKEANEKYLSADFCDHSHMMTRALKDCATRDELIARPVGQYKPAKLGDKIVMPHMATVDGDMVTMYGEGVDIFRVKDGKITDHWDASPPKGVTIHAHKPEVVEHMIKVLAGEAEVASGPNAPPANAKP